MGDFQVAAGETYIGYRREYLVYVPEQVEAVEKYICEIFPQCWLDLSGVQEDIFNYECDEDRVIDGVIFCGAIYNVKIDPSLDID